MTHTNDRPDHGIPVDGRGQVYPKDMLDMIRDVRAYCKQLDNHASPIVVHCSAGVGRTGSYIAIDQAMDAYEQGQMIDVNNLVRRFRKERMALIQHATQYKFSCIALAKWIKFMEKNTAEAAAAPAAQNPFGAPSAAPDAAAVNPFAASTSGGGDAAAPTDPFATPASSGSGKSSPNPFGSEAAEAMNDQVSLRDHSAARQIKRNRNSFIVPYLDQETPDRQAPAANPFASLEKGTEEDDSASHFASIASAAASATAALVTTENPFATANAVPSSAINPFSSPAPASDAAGSTAADEAAAAERAAAAEAEEAKAEADAKATEDAKKQEEAKATAAAEAENKAAAAAAAAATAEAENEAAAALAAVEKDAEEVEDAPNSAAAAAKDAAVVQTKEDGATSFGFAIEGAANDAEKIAAADRRKGLWVAAIADGSAAAAGNISVGMRILSINGTSTEDVFVEDAIELLTSTGGNTLLLEVEDDLTTFEALPVELEASVALPPAAAGDVVQENVGAVKPDPAEDNTNGDGAAKAEPKPAVEPEAAPDAASATEPESEASANDDTKEGTDLDAADDSDNASKDGVDGASLFKSGERVTLGSNASMDAAYGPLEDGDVGTVIAHNAGDGDLVEVSAPSGKSWKYLAADLERTSKAVLAEVAKHDVPIDTTSAPEGEVAASEEGADVGNSDKHVEGEKEGNEAEVRPETDGGDGDDGLAKEEGLAASIEANETDEHDEIVDGDEVSEEKAEEKADDAYAAYSFNFSAAPALTEEKTAPATEESKKEDAQIKTPEPSKEAAKSAPEPPAEAVERVWDEPAGVFAFDGNTDPAKAHPKVLSREEREEKEQTSRAKAKVEELASGAHVALGGKNDTHTELLVKKMMEMEARMAEMEEEKEMKEKELQSQIEAMEAKLQAEATQKPGEAAPDLVSSSKVPLIELESVTLRNLSGKVQASKRRLSIHDDAVVGMAAAAAAVVAGGGDGDGSGKDDGNAAAEGREGDEAAAAEVGGAQRRPKKVGSSKVNDLRKRLSSSNVDLFNITAGPLWSDLEPWTYINGKGVVGKLWGELNPDWNGADVKPPVGCKKSSKRTAVEVVGPAVVGHDHVWRNIKGGLTVERKSTQ